MLLLIFKFFKIGLYGSDCFIKCNKFDNQKWSKRLKTLSKMFYDFLKIKYNK